MSPEQANAQLKIIAGPCSIDTSNIKEIYQISQIEVKNRQGKHQRAIAGTRIVGVKSRTAYTDTGEGLGIDAASFIKNIERLHAGAGVRDLETPPSVLYTTEVINRTGLIVAVEIMNPLVQLGPMDGRIPHGKLMPWNPAVNQLGWPMREMALFAKRNGWHIGVKNGKWVGESLHTANAIHYTGQTTMEKTWAGLTKYVGAIEGDIILIHRGVDTPDKGKYRNLPVHQIALRTKISTGHKLYFDPSHAYGPQMKEDIVPAVIEAMKMKLSDNHYLYDGVLVEVGTSTTDTGQHITLKELETMVSELTKFRDLVAPE